MQDSEKQYQESMEPFCSGDTPPFISDKQFEKLHEKYQQEAKSRLAGKLEGAASSYFNPLNTELSYEVTLEQVRLNVNVVRCRFFKLCNPNDVFFS